MKNTMWLSSSDITRQLKISLRQLYYWELKGIIKPRLITMEVLSQIKDFLDEGYTLNSAVRRAQTEP